MKISTSRTFAMLMVAMATNSAFAGTPFKSVTLSKAATARVEAEDFDKDGDGVSFHWNVDRTDKNIADYRKAADPTAAVFASGGSNGHHIGELDGGVFTVYTVDVADAGPYKIVMACSKDNDQPRDYKFTLVGKGVETSGVFSDHAHGWENFASKINAQIDFPEAGTYEVKFETGGGYNIDYFDFTYAADFGQGMEIPGTLDLLKWDLGGAEVSYHWAAMTNEGRPSPKGDGDELGHTSGGDWVNYTVDVKQAGYYDLTPGISKGNEGNMEFTLTDAETGKNLSPYITFSYESNNAWGNYDDFGPMPQAVYLPEGKTTIRLTFLTGFNAKYLTFTYSETQQAPDVDYGQGIELPGIFDAANFDKGGDGVSFQWNNVSNGRFSTPSMDGGHHIGETSGGDWVNYTVDVKQAGVYDITVNYADGAADHNAEIAFYNGDTNLTGTLVCEPSGENAWGTYVDKTFEKAITLEKGKVTLKLMIVRDPLNIHSFAFTYNENATAIQNVDAAVADKWYNLQGIEVAQPQKGIYILNGRKVVIK